MSLKMNVEGKEAWVAYGINGKSSITYVGGHPGTGPVVTKAQVESGEARDIVRENTYPLDEIPGHYWDLVQRVEALEKLVLDLVRTR